jgi:IMP cyclohydrolase
VSDLDEFAELSRNSYPGRGFVVGLAPSGINVYQVYWITGRSIASRNRVLVRTARGVDARFRTPQPGVDQSLFEYAAMRDSHGLHVVSNGVHTNTILEGITRGPGLRDNRCGTFP